MIRLLKIPDLELLSSILYIKALPNPEHTVIAVIDCSFLRKSGKKTDGKAYFYNGVAGKSEQGLEISVISIVEIESRLSYSLSVQQTPSRSHIMSGRLTMIKILPYCHQ
ncbi:hypothetical protein NDI40_27450 [Microcoleus vaginatus ZQ-A3]|uniref:hypothetical protein n=1 Tax=Microcoleus vaginatus TaxID=119532 RepID=UPI0032A98BAC